MCSWCCLTRDKKPHQTIQEDSTEHPILDALLAHERLDDIIELLVDSLLLRLHAASRNHPPSTSTSSSSSSSSSLSVGSNKSEAAVFGLVEGLHLLCFSDDFAQRLIGHPLFREGHVLHSLVHVLTVRQCLFFPLVPPLPSSSSLLLCALFTITR